MLKFLFWLAEKTKENQIVIGMLVIYAAFHFMLKWVFSEEVQ